MMIEEVIINMCISQMHFCYIMIVFQKLYLVHLPTAILSVSSTQ